jgi:hypothetical protein
MKINQISVDAALASLNSSRQGLVSAEAARRRAENTRRRGGGCSCNSPVFLR